MILTMCTETLRKYPTLSLLQDVHPAALTTQSLPANTHTILANLATGTSSSSHGIVGPTWRRPVTGELVSAYSAEGLSFAANIADILLQETNGLSLVVSASASPSFASALAAHPELVGENIGWRAHAYALTENGFESRYESPSVDQVLQFKDIDLAEVKMMVGNVEVVFRPRDNHADYELFAELAFVRNLIAALQSDGSLNAQVMDSVPDMYSFVFSSLKGIQTRYGEESDTFAAALTLVDKTCAALISTLNALYNNRVAVVVAALNARDVSTQAQKQAVYNKVARLLYNEADFAAFYPNVYVRTEEFNGYTRDITCSNLQQAVSNGKVLCMSPFLPVRARNDVGSSQSESEGYIIADDQTDEDYLWAFWLNFFITLILFSFIGWGVYCLTFVGIDASKDTLLFRATSKHHKN